MNILLYDMSSYTQKDIIYYLQQAGHHCKNILYKMKDIYQDDFFERRFEQYLQEGAWDFVMSTNFSPVVANLCYKFQIKYLSWVYDSPIDTEHIEYYQYPTSYIFLFDRLEVQRILALGGVNIFHLPLAVPLHRVDNLNITKEDTTKYSADISFIGQFYDSPLNQLMYCQEEYDKGYVNAIVQTQLKVYGYNFIGEMVSDDLIQRMNEHLHTDQTGTVLSRSGLVHSIEKQVTHTERLVLCNMLGQIGQMNYYSNSKQESLSHLNYCGTAFYRTEMPKIFFLSKLNLNPTLRSIQSGIPLRALDIMSCKGTLLCNYQPELAGYFTDGEDVIMYESIEDALCKADYYLKHNDLREHIAQNGYEKTLTLFAYPDKLKTMFETAGIL